MAKKDYTVSVKTPDGSYKEIDLDKINNHYKNKLNNLMAKPIKSSIITKEFLKYEFSHDELHEKGGELARLNSELFSIENEAKAVASNFKAKKDGKLAEIEVLVGQINTGSEHRYIECEVKYNDPNTGVKSTFRQDTGALVKKEGMSAEEMQLELDLGDKEPDDDSQ